MLLRRGLALEYATLGWNVIGMIVLAITALAAGSVALGAFGIDSLIEILASTMVVWQLKGTDSTDRTAPALRIIASRLLAWRSTSLRSPRSFSASHPGHSVAGAVWLAVTALVMFALARGKADTGRRLQNKQARITIIDGALATIILLGVVLNTSLGWWWADPTAALTLVLYAAREAQHTWRDAGEQRR